MSKQTRTPLPEADALVFYDLLRRKLQEQKFNSIAEAVPPVFVDIRTKEPADHPLRQYSESKLRGAALDIPGIIRQELNKLCTIPEKALETSTPVRKKTIFDTILHSPEDKIKFLEEAIADPSRPKLSIRYGVSLIAILPIFKHCILHILPNTHWWLEGPEGVLARFNSGLLKKSHPLLEEVDYNSKTQFFSPKGANWPSHPTHEEIDALTGLQNTARLPEPASEVTIQTSLSGGTASDMMPTQSGKLPPRARTTRMIHGR